MAIEFGRARREGALLRMTVRLTDEAADCSLRARATTQQGDKVPVCARPGEDEGEWQLEVAALSVTQTIEAVASSWEGTEVERATQRVNPLATRLGVGASRRRGTAGTSHDVALGFWTVVVDRLVRTADGVDVCQGHATLVGAGRQEVEGAVQVRLLDARGDDAAIGEWLCLDDTIAAHPGHPGFFVRRLEFSVRVSPTTTSLVVWVEPAGEHGLPEGFCHLAPRAVAMLREAWRTHATPAAEDETYDEWYRTRHAARPMELAMQRETSFDYEPLMSVVVVVREADPAHLRETVESVLDQTYAKLELVLVSAATIDRRLATTARSLELSDARVRSVPLAADFGVAASTSEGVDAAVGEFACLVAEGDLLAPDALYCVVAELQHGSAPDLLYTDEDRVGPSGHSHPTFKPDWDPDLLLSCNYVGGLMVVRTSVIAELETMGSDLDGAHDYRMALYASARAKGVCHVPRVLYHMRDARTTRGGVTSAAANLAALRADEAVRTSGALVRASSRVPAGHEVTYEVQGEPLVSVIIPNCDNVASLDRCLASVRALTSYAHYEVIVVEHGSVEPETFEYYRRAEREDERVRTVYVQGGEARDEAHVLDFGISRAKGDYLLLLGSDVEVTDAGWMTRLLSLCQRHGVGAVAARTVRPDGTVWECGLSLSQTGLVVCERHRDTHDGGHLDRGLLLHGVTAASASCLLVRADAYRELGGMGKGFPEGYCTPDLCLRLRNRGYRVVLDPQVMLTRRCASGEVGERTADDVRAIGRLWGAWPYGRSAADATGNPNLDPQSPYGALIR